MRLYFVFFLFGIVSGHFSAVVAPRFFDHALFSEKVGTLDSAFLIGGFENETIAEIQSENAGFFAAKRWDERSR
jgi:hypothetical protein